jgi:hypothetical protein
MKKSNDQIAQGYKNKKQVFLSKLKNSMYSDSLIESWLDTFKDDSNTSQFLHTIEMNNEQWKQFKKKGKNIQWFVDEIYKIYIDQMPHGLVIPLMICGCEDVKNEWYFREFTKNVKVFEINGMTIVDMSN